MVADTVPTRPRVFQATTLSRIPRDVRCGILVFAAGIAIRSIPNLIAGMPIGYDTPLYAVQILDWKALLSDTNALFRSPLLSFTLGLFYEITHADPFAMLGITQPLLYGLLALSFYLMSKTTLKYSQAQANWSLIATLIFLLQTVTLRISWDLLKNELGLAMLLFTVAAMKDMEKRPILFTTLSLLTALSHSITTVILGVIIIAQIGHKLHEKDLVTAKRLIVYSLPVAFLGLGVIASATGLHVIEGTPYSSNFPRVINAQSKPSLFFPFFNYLGGDSFINYSGSYSNLLRDFVYLFAASYLPLLPLVLLGIRRLRELSICAWTSLCVIATVTVVLSPTFAFISWERSMMMLVVPFVLFATEGLLAAMSKLSPKQRNTLLVATIVVYGAIAIPYLVSSPTNPISLYAVLWSSTKYSPPTLLRQGTPLDDIPNVKQALVWLDTNLAANSCLLTRETFVSFARIYLNRNATIVDYGVDDVDVGLDHAKTLNFSAIYWIWWKGNNSVGLSWYGQNVPDYFEPIYEAGNITLYKYPTRARH